jgi:hypothetical protein
MPERTFPRNENIQPVNSAEFRFDSWAGRWQGFVSFQGRSVAPGKSKAGEVLPRSKSRVIYG